MYSPLALYYLNQIGITPWINKGIEEQPKTDPKLLVLIPSKQSKKAQALLKKMMAFINVPEQELSLIPIESLSNAQLDNTSLQAILGLGFNETDLPEDATIFCPIVSSLDPDYLVKNPGAKKRVFQDLLYVNSLL